MRLICITDLHGRLESLRRILADAGHCDVVLFGGDITSFGTPTDAARVIQVAQQSAPTVLAVAGNCDSAAIDAELDRLGVGLHGRGLLCENVGIHGLSAIPPWKRGMYQLPEAELEAAIRRGYAAIDGAGQRVLLAHVPPRGMKVDRTFFWVHAGSTAVREFVERTQPALVLCGHIHEGRGAHYEGSTLLVNPGPAAHGYYALIAVEQAPGGLRAVADLRAL